MFNNIFEDFDDSFDQMLLDNEEQKQKDSVWNEVMKEFTDNEDIYFDGDE